MYIVHLLTYRQLLEAVTLCKNLERPLANRELLQVQQRTVCDIKKHKVIKINN